MSGLFEGFGDWKNTDAIRAGENRLPPEGLYDWKVDNVKRETKKADGSPMLILECRILNGDHEGTKFDKIYNVKSLPYLLGDLETMGVALGREPEAEDIHGREFSGYLQHRDYQGKKYGNLFVRGPVGDTGINF